jgi:hypothetical protein
LHTLPDLQEWGRIRSPGCQMELSYIFSYYSLLCWILQLRIAAYPWHPYNHP